MRRNIKKVCIFVFPSCDGVLLLCVKYQLDMTETNVKKDWKKEVWSYCLLVIGSALFAVGDVMFVNPYHLAPGGVYGLANVFNA